MGNFPDTISADFPASTGLIRSNGRGADVLAFEESVLGFFVEAADLLGVPKSLAAIYGICFASAEPLTFSNIQEHLALSAGSISQGLKVLREVGALKVVHAEADRREFFVPDLELRKLVDRWINERLRKQLGTGRQRLQAMDASIPNGRSASSKVLRERIEHLQNWHNKASAVLPVISGFLKLS